MYSSTKKSEQDQALQLRVITPDKTIFRDQVDHVILPTVDGEMGIYAHHATVLTKVKVKEGCVKVHLTDQRTLSLSFDHGLAQVKGNILTLLIHGKVKMTE